MSFGFNIDVKDGVHHLKGHVDESADFGKLPLPAAGAPLKLNLRGVQSINSLGIKRLIEFMRALGDGKVELHDCPPVFVEAVNVIPLVVGGQSRISRIRSVLLPFNCANDHEAVHTVNVADVAVGDDVRLPRLDCPQCKARLEPDLDSELHEFFFFLMA